MGGSRFDLWTRRRFGRLAAGSAAALIGPATRRKTEARKKRRKKRKKAKPKQSCRALREECSSDPAEECCGTLVCNDNSCIGDPVCVQPEGGPCRDICDCRLGLECSTRASNTCRQCVLL